MKNNHLTLVLCLIFALVASTASGLLVVESSDTKPVPPARQGEVNTQPATVAGASTLESERADSSAARSGRDAESTRNARVRESYGQLPLSFEANQGQTDSRVKFVSRNSGYNLFLTSDESVITFQRGNEQARPNDSADASPLAAQRSSFALRMKLAGANTRPRVAGIDMLSGKSNYLTGNDSRRWRRNVPTYARVRYEAIYRGIDLVYYGNQRKLEYDFIVSPGADASRIKLDFTGADNIRIDVNGDLVLKLAGEEIRQLAPKAYQEIDGVKQSVTCRYELRSAHRVQFEVGAYDKTQQLVIDPILNYSTLLGGADYELGYSVAVGSGTQGDNAFITGSTLSPNFPTTSGAYQRVRGGYQNDVFVAKLNQDGSSLVYSTYIGGSNNDIAYDLAVDGAGQAFVVGAMESSDFPTTQDAYSRSLPGGRHGFVLKLSSAGDALAFSTLLGGSSDDLATTVAIDSSGTYVGGRTHSTNFPTTAGAFQTACTGNCTYYNGFISKLDLTGRYLDYSTYVGLSTETRLEAIAVDGMRRVYATGSTGNQPPPLGVSQIGPGGGQDGFVIRLNTTVGGPGYYATFLGGSGNDYCAAIAVDSQGNAYVTGNTDSIDYPSTPNAFRGHIFGAGDGYNAFVTKLTSTGTLSYSTFLEGNGDDRGRAIAVDSTGNAYVTGETSSINFPTTDDAIQVYYEGGKSDAFVTKLNATGTTLVYSSYWGGTGEESAYGIALDGMNNVYLTGIVMSQDLPTSASAYQRSLNGGSDAFISKLGMSEPNFMVSGRVTNDLNNPLKGVAVSISGPFGRTVHTNANGNYAIGGLEPGGHFTLTATRGAFVFSPSNVEFPSLQQNETLDFSGPAPLVISGTLKDINGYPLSRSVSLSGSATATVQSDDSGHYAFNDLAQGGNYTVTPSSYFSNFSPVSASVIGLSGDVTRDFTELPPLTIWGQINNEYGQGVGVTVTLSGDASETKETDWQGRFWFYPARGGNYTVTPSSSYFTFSPVSQSVSSISEDQTFNFTALRPLFIEGHIRNEYGTAISNLEVVLTGTTSATTTTSWDGWYSFNDLPRAGTYTVTPSATRYTFTPPGQTVSNINADQTLDFSGLPPSNIWGKVSGDSGNVEGVTITIVGGTVNASTVTNSSGYYYSPELPRGGTYTITASHPLYTITPSSQTVTNTVTWQEANFAATRIMYSVSGRVIDGSGGPVPSVAINLFGDPWTETDASGNYSITIQAGASFLLVPSKSGWTFIQPNYSNGDLRDNQIVNFVGTRLPLSISGRVVDSVGAALSGVAVSLTGSQSSSALTDTLGNYTFTALPPGGNYTVTASMANYTLSPASRSFTNLSSSQSGDFIATRITYTLSGRVTEGAAGLAGANLILTGGQTVTSQTDSNGNYAFPALPAGVTYVIEVSLANYTFTPWSRAYGSLDRNHSDADFARTTYSVSGRITEGAAGLGGVSVTLTGGQTATAQTDSNGNYAFSPVLQGNNYTVTPSLANFVFSPATKSFANLSANVSGDFSGTRLTYTVSGRVTEGAAGLGGVNVVLTGPQTIWGGTDSNGNYTFANLPAGSNYTVTPSRTHYSFSPANASFTNLNANQSADFAGTRLTWAVSGRITDNGAGLGGVTVALTGSQTGSSQTDAAGNYIFTALPIGGNYTVTPSLANYSFSPATKSFTNITSNEYADFAGTRFTHTVSGRITESGGAGLGGVTVVLTGTQTGSSQTDAAGNYTFLPLWAGGTYTITPSLPNFSFSPASRSFTNLQANQSADFAGTRFTYTVSGRITEGAAGLGGVTVALSGSQTGSSQTDAAGNYTFTALSAGGNYTVTPSLANFSFSPATRSFTNLAANQSGDFAGTRFTYSVTGRITVGAAGLVGVTVTLSGGQAGTAQTDSAGNYSFANLAAGSNYTVSPSKTHYTFSPPSTSFNSLSSNSSANFSATLLTHSISGRVLDGGGAAMGGVSVSLSGWQTGSGTTDSGGNYAFLSLPAGGNYTITTSKALYSFSPSTQTFSDLGANQTANFTGSLVNFGITGRVTEGGVALAGVTITLSGGLSATTLTNAAGTYAFSGLPAGGNYNVSASAAYYAFLPLTWTFNGLAANQTADFIAARLTYQVSGTVQNSCGTAIAGVTMTLSRSGVNATTATDATGNYTFAGVQAGFNYSLTPAKAGHTFNPASLLFSNLNSNQSANFSGAPAVANTPFAAIADSYVTGGSSANSNFGSLTQLITRLASSNSNTFETYLTFNVGQLCTVSSVKLRMFGKLSSSNPANLNVQAFPVSTTTWTEAGITWNNKPAAGALLATATIVNTTATWYEWDVTAYVRAEIAAGRNVVSMVLRNQATSSNQVTFNSGEATSNQPQLLVTTP